LLRCALEIHEIQASPKACDLELEQSSLKEEVERLSSVVTALFAGVSALEEWCDTPQPISFDSAIISKLPALLAEFGGKRFWLLWRGGRDGFDRKEFHRRCDGHANTLTLIEDTDGNIFGGFTPAKWKSVHGTSPKKTVSDEIYLNSKSFLFTLKNPHNFPARKFTLKAEKNGETIVCSPSGGPNFCDIQVSDDCDADSNSDASDFGDCYTNDTGVDGRTFFTGSEDFTVEEIEVFEITG
jgi:hypothetical protein